MTPDQHRTELVSRMNAKALAGTLELIADDAVYFWSNGVALSGKKAIAEGLKQNFQGIQNDTYEMSDVTWLFQSDDGAACVYEFHWTGDINGKPVSGGGRGTSVLRKIDGEWRTVHEHLSAGAWKPAAPRS